MINPHHPDRPSWRCRSCGQPWPCPPARFELRIAYGADRAGLARHLGDLLFTAARESNADAADLYDRFIAWTDPP